MKQATKLSAVATAVVAVFLLSGYKWNSDVYKPEFFCPDASNNGNAIISENYLACFYDCNNYSTDNKYCDNEANNKNNRGVPKALLKAVDDNTTTAVNKRFMLVDKTQSGKSINDIKNEYLKTFPEIPENKVSGNLFLDIDKGEKISYGFATDSNGNRVHNGISIMKDNTHIKVTFVYESAAIANTLAYFTYKINSDGKPTDMNGTVINGSDFSNRSRLQEIVLYPNYSSVIGDSSEIDKDDSGVHRALGSTKTLQTGQTAILGPFDKGVQVGFVVITGGYDRKTGVDPLYGWTYELGGTMGNTVGDKDKYDFYHKHIHDTTDDNHYQDRGTWFYYSLPELNRELGTESNIKARERAHSVSLYTLTEDPNYPYYIVGFEDYPNNHPFGDRDMNDLILMVESVEPAGITKECTDLNLNQEGLQCDELTCAMVDASAPDALKSKTVETLGLGGTLLDFDNDGLENSQEAPGQVCVAQTQCYDESLVNLSGSSVGTRLFHAANADVVSPDYTTNGLSLNDQFRMYKAGYNSSNFSGQVKSYSYTNGTESNEWSFTLPASRTVYTKDFANANSKTLKLLDLANLPTDDIRREFVFGSPQDNNTASEALAELTKAAIIEHKSNAIGAVFNSNPLYIGKPSSNYQFENYYAFSKAQASRAAQVYVASNNGKLHAINAADGTENFAYIPHVAFENLYKVKQNQGKPTFTNDGKLIAADISDGSTASDGSNWKTVLVGMLGGGGKGMYALDITDPQTPKLQWELSTHDLAAQDGFKPALGYTLADAVIVHAEFKATSGTEKRWVMIVGNGYYAGNYLDYNDATNGLVIVDMLTGQYMFVPVQSSGLTKEGGLGSPAAVDFDGNGNVDIVYVGGLDGKLWKFDLRQISFQANAVSSKHDSIPVFDTQGLPITVAPTVIRYSNSEVQVVFGTGKYFESGDDSVKDASSQVNAIFSIRDKKDIPTQQSDTLHKSDLSKGEIKLETTQEIAGSGFEAFRLFDNSVNYASTHGWYLPLSYNNSLQGEMIVEPAVYVEGLSRAFGSQTAGILMSSLIINAGATSCSHSGWLMAFDPFTGKALDGMDFKNKGVAVANTIVKDSKQYGILGGKVSGRIGSGSNLVGDGNDVNQFNVNGDMISVDAKDKPEGRMNWRILELEQ